MFYPLDKAAQDEWAETVRLPQKEFLSRLAAKARKFDCVQEETNGAVRWQGQAGNLELMLFRIPDPGNLESVQAVYQAIAEENCPIAYALVNQRGEHRDAWDVFHFSRLSYLCHGNRISGPGSECGD
jgi:hypothetical protein